MAITEWRDDVARLLDPVAASALAFLSSSLPRVALEEGRGRGTRRIWMPGATSERVRQALLERHARVTRETVKSALKKLKANGLVVYERGSGEWRAHPDYVARIGWLCAVDDVRRAGVRAVPVDLGDAPCSVYLVGLQAPSERLQEDPALHAGLADFAKAVAALDDAAREEGLVVVLRFPQSTAVAGRRD